MERKPKLVRDKIPEVITNRGEHCSWEIVTGEIRNRLLVEKYFEEAGEVLAATNREELVEELGDSADVFDALIEAFNISPEELSEARARKELEKGAFRKGIVLTEW